MDTKRVWQAQVDSEMKTFLSSTSKHTSTEAAIRIKGRCSYEGKDEKEFEKKNILDKTQMLRIY